MRGFADFIIEKRLPILIIFLLITLFFTYTATTLKVLTQFGDLLPQQHEYIKLHNTIRHLFGGANHVTMLLQVREGDIFNRTTLQKIKDISEELHLIPAVDRFKILSIAMLRLKDMTVTAEGFNFEPLMPRVPRTDEEVESVREKVYASVFFGAFISFDGKKTMISADFFEDEIDYGVVFKELNRIREKYEDDNHILSIAGEPMHLGYVDSYVGAVFRIMLITFLVVLFLFYYWYRSLRATMLPILAALLSGIWGLGFMSLMGYNLDPLILVFPFLVASRAACHTVQVIKRYTEECVIAKEPKRACKRVIEGLFIPGFTAITTDAMGIILIALTPIRILQKITLSCTFWCIAQIVIAMILVPIVLSYMPISPRLLKKFEQKGVLDRILARVGNLMGGRGSLVVFAMVPILIILGYWGAKDIKVGDILPGSSLFWPWHRYNQDGFRISFNMPVLSPLYIVIGGGKGLIGETPDIFREIYRFERFMRETPGRKIIFTRSITATFAGANSMMHEGHPHWNFFPYEDGELRYSFRRIMYTGQPGDNDMYIDAGEVLTNIIIYCRDKTADTIQVVMDRVKEYNKNHSRLKGSWQFQLAGGTIGVQSAINEVIDNYHFKTLQWALLAIFLICCVMFRSISAAVILTIPLIVSNIIAFAMMATGIFHLLPVPITITTSTLPVSAVGIGLGVDYGIYMLGRILEEYKISQDLKGAISLSMTSVGEPVIFTAVAMTAGIIFWVFSPLMFQATMGFFLATILLLNMLGGLLLVPSFVAVIKPKFVTKLK
jgi:predicted RND superfamily exporter protein